MTSQDDMSAMIARVADRHDVPLAVLLAVMASLVRSGVRPNLARLEQLLGRKAREVVALRRRLDQASQDAAVGEARRKAARALESGQFLEVERALAQLELHFFGGMTDLSTMPSDRRIAAGETRSDRAATALLDLTPAACKEAAQRYAEAAAIIGTANLDRSREFALRQGDSLARIGEDFADPAGFEAAIAHFRTLLSRLDNFDDTIAWATAQERLARALAGLAQLTGDDKRLDEALACCRTALEDLRHDQAPLLWRALKMRFGRIAIPLGDLREDDALLEEAVSCLATALARWSRDGDEVRWLEAEQLISRGRAALGRRTSDLALLERAFNGFNRVAKTVDRTREPLRWAELQDQMGGVLAAMGERYSEPVVLEEAVAAFGAALEERRRERSPQLWAASAASQGLASMQLAARRKDPGMAQQAFMQIAAAVEAMREAGHSADVATLQKKLVLAGSLAEGMRKR
jgi:tetratricopeptide (TPR) repeat protein